MRWDVNWLQHVSVKKKKTWDEQHAEQCDYQQRICPSSIYQLECWRFQASKLRIAWKIWCLARSIVWVVLSASQHCSPQKNNEFSTTKLRFPAWNLEARNGPCNSSRMWVTTYVISPHGLGLPRCSRCWNGSWGITQNTCNSLDNKIDGKSDQHCARFMFWAVSTKPWFMTWNPKWKITRYLSEGLLLFFAGLGPALEDFSNKISCKLSISWIFQLSELS